LKQLVALDKSRPGKLNYSSGGTGTGPMLATEVLKANTGMTAVHIAYKGAGPALIDLVAGQVDFQLANMIASLPFVKSGRLRGIAVSGSKRSAALPELPTVSEAGVPGLEEVGGHMIMVPGATSKDIVARLHQELVKVLQQSEVKARLEGEGAEIFGTAPEKSAAIVRSEIERMAKIIKRLGLQAS
jgi:tripartite-type tricarboxylate transporter receptor subunit TctC